MTASATAPFTPTRAFVPKNLDASNFANVRPLYEELLTRPVDSPVALERWLLDFSELSAVMDEFGSRRYIAKSCHTDDAEIEKQYIHYVEEIEPKIKPLFFRLQKKFLDQPHRAALATSDKRYAMLGRAWRAEYEIYRDENVPLATEVTKIVNEYDKLCGAMLVNYRGKEQTLQQMARYYEEPDRATREEAWKLVQQRRLRDREAVEGLFDQLLALRERIAKNAELPDFRAYAWKAYKRFDYTPDDCLRFSDAIEKTCMPLVHELDRQRGSELKLEMLRPWDVDVDPKNRPALRPFAEDQTSVFVDQTREIFNRMSPDLAADFETLRTRNNLDLASRKGKQPGGYQAALEECREPFIFMNAAGVQRDVETLLHEGGHAFHCLAARHEPLMFLRSAPMEFCEVASMSMELLGSDHFDAFYGQSPDAARAKRTMLENIIRFFPWMTTIDSFQHWLYTHPGHSRDERAAFWLSLLDRFDSRQDWTGHEDSRRYMWQQQLHLFHVPFYYVEYGIAQLGALQLWMKAKEDPRRALANYRSALALGGTRALPELFRAAGLEFDFSEKTLRPLMQAIQEELGALPA